jgi:3',5'-cyclic AMP phosphodiesterase CpdA
MSTIVHISDLHFGRERGILVTGLRKSLMNLQPELVIVSGDITQRAKNKEFLAARSFFDTLAWPLLVIAGNHDIPAFPPQARLFKPWKRWQQHLGYDLEPIFKGRDFTAIGVNTVRRAGSLFDWSRGRINKDQTHNIVRQLNKESETTLRIIVAHHPFWLPSRYIHRHIIGGQSMAIKMLKQFGADLILGGHVHFAYTHLLEGLIVSHAGTAVSSRFQAEATNDFKVIRGDRQRLSISKYTWNGQHFSSLEPTVFTRRHGEWTQP